MAEVPKAKAIIAEFKGEFSDWNDMRKNAPVLRAVKQKLFDMHHCQMFLSAYKPTLSSSLALVGDANMLVADMDTTAQMTVNQFAIHRVIKNMAVKMRKQHQPGCSYIEAINDFITSHSN